jgi:hypothetical protein
MRATVTARHLQDGMEESERVASEQCSVDEPERAHGTIVCHREAHTEAGTAVVPLASYDCDVRLRVNCWFHSFKTAMKQLY